MKCKSAPMFIHISRCKTTFMLYFILFYLEGHQNYQKSKLKLPKEIKLHTIPHLRVLRILLFKQAKHRFHFNVALYVLSQNLQSKNVNHSHSSLVLESCDVIELRPISRYTLGYTQLMHTLSYLVPVYKHVSCSSSIKLAQVTSCRVTQKKKKNKFPSFSYDKYF